MEVDEGNLLARPFHLPNPLHFRKAKPYCSMNPKPLRVACAILQNEAGGYLCAQRGKGMDNEGKWEFPGGKLEENESVQACIVREIREETGMDIEPLEEGPEFESVLPSGRSLLLLPVLCRHLQGQPEAREHMELRWCDASEMQGLDWAEADVPIVEWVLAGGV